MGKTMLAHSFCTNSVMDLTGVRRQNHFSSPPPYFVSSSGVTRLHFLHLKRKQARQENVTNNLNKCALTCCTRPRNLSLPKTPDSQEREERSAPNGPRCTCPLPQQARRQS